MMDDGTVKRLDLLLDALISLRPPGGVFVKPKLDLEAHRLTGICCQGIAPVRQRFRRDAVLRSPGPDVEQIRKEFAPRPSLPFGMFSLARKRRQRLSNL